MKLLIFGDVHGEWSHLNATIAKGLRKYPDTTGLVQVGDLGYAWPGDRKGFKLSKAFFPSIQEYDKAIDTPFYWIDGNHENYDRLDADQGARQPNMIYQSRGSIREFDTGDSRITTRRAMFFGGATSHDRDERIHGKDWWPQEAITYRQVLTALDQPGPIDIMFSHEHPVSFPYSDARYGADDIKGMGDKQALEAIRLHFKPRFSVFGHHHAYAEGETDGTKWICAPIIDSRKYVVYDEERIYLDD